MKTLLPTILRLQKSIGGNYWGERITAELAYGHRVSLYAKNKYHELLKSTASFLQTNNGGVVTKELCELCETMLSPMKDDCKSYSLHLASHSHIDLNFLWGYDETVSVVLNTFSTMLTLLGEYKTFIYSQSSAAAYDIVQKYAPEMIGEIKRYVHEGRWELTASTWVEADKNMPNTQSQVKQLVVAKNYMAKLFDVSPDSIKIDFEPDTFGHSKNMPEILQSGGVDYYYFCRGHNNINNIFVWEADSGKQVIAYKEPHWYDSRIQTDIVLTIPEFCHDNNVDTMMKVYGVGDHGGGPTRRDLERALDMATWSIFPTIYFGTYHSYFALLEKNRDKFPIVHDELAPLFTGCYSSQSKIKSANKNAETLLYQANLLNAFSTANAGDIRRSALLEEGWKSAMFSQFHDILPGSCTAEVKDYALGKQQEIVAAANTVRAKSLEAIAKEIDTSCYIDNCAVDEKSYCMGAGSGVFVGDKLQTGIPEKGTGQTRLFNVFNTTQYKKTEIVEVLLWDYDDNVDTILVLDSKGNQAAHQIIKKDFDEHWGHFYLTLYVECTVDAFGYETYLLTQKDEYELDEIDKMKLDYKLVTENSLPQELHEAITLENERVKATFDPMTFAIISLVDKLTGFEHCKRPTGVFRHILEDRESGGNAWIIGRYAKINPISTFKLVGCNTGGIRQFITLETGFESSTMRVEISLNKGDNKLVYKVNCDFLEKSGKDFISQLNFVVNTSYLCHNYIYDIPAGTISRGASSTDNCGVGFVVAEGGESRLMLTSNSKYGYRCQNDSMSITLLRATGGPDRYSELGQHVFSFAIAVVDNKIQSAFKVATDLSLPMIPISTTASAGSLPLNGGFVELYEDNALVYSIESCKENEWLIGLLEIAGHDGLVKLDCMREVQCAVSTDLLGRPIDGEISFFENTITIEVKANAINNVLIKFK